MHTSFLIFGKDIRAIADKVSSIVPARTCTLHIFYLRKVFVVIESASNFLFPGTNGLSCSAISMSMVTWLTRHVRPFYVVRCG